MEIQISIHVPAKGTTPHFYCNLANVSISIHVPAKGTTFVVHYSLFDFFISIHVPAKGTTLEVTPINNFLKFQSTFPRRERRIFDTKKDFPTDFNPRSREGNDVVNLMTKINR